MSPTAAVTLLEVSLPLFLPFDPLRHVDLFLLDRCDVPALLGADRGADSLPLVHAPLQIVQASSLRLGIRGRVPVNGLQLSIELRVLGKKRLVQRLLPLAGHLGNPLGRCVNGLHFNIADRQFLGTVQMLLNAVEIRPQVVQRRLRRLVAQGLANVVQRKVRLREFVGELRFPTLFLLQLHLQPGDLLLHANVLPDCLRETIGVGFRPLEVFGPPGVNGILQGVGRRDDLVLEALVGDQQPDRNTDEAHDHGRHGELREAAAQGRCRTTRNLA